MISTDGADVTDQIRRLREAPQAQRRETYLAERVDDQVEYYTRRTGDHQR